MKIGGKLVENKKLLGWSGKEEREDDEGEYDQNSSYVCIYVIVK